MEECLEAAGLETGYLEATGLETGSMEAGGLEAGGMEAGYLEAGGLLGGRGQVKAEIIRRLRETDGYVSGQELCDQLRVSRTAVWKVISQLKVEGYQIEAVRNRGYRLLEDVDVLNEAECQSRLDGRWLGQPVKCYGETDSTNIRARILAEEGAPEGTLVIADSQTKGKGRRGRGWVSPPGEGLWFSLLLRPQIPPSDAPAITLVSAVSVAAGIEDVTGLSVMIKWPNDLVFSGKKLAGILTELSAEAEQVHYVVTGIGINVNMAEFPDEIRATATSLFLESGRRWNRCDLVAAIMNRMEEYYRIYLATHDLRGLLGQYSDRLVSLHREVLILSPEKEHQGVCEGIDEKGRLLVRLGDGSVEKVMSGEVSVRGIYGYV